MCITIAVAFAVVNWLTIQGFKHRGIPDFESIDERWQQLADDLGQDPATEPPAARGTSTTSHPRGVVSTGDHPSWRLHHAAILRTFRHLNCDDLVRSARSARRAVGTWVCERP